MTALREKPEVMDWLKRAGEAGLGMSPQEKAAFTAEGQKSPLIMRYRRMAAAESLLAGRRLQVDLG